MKIRNRPQGFTLIELLIVIAIVGILAAVLLPNLLGSRQQAFDTGALNCARALRTAQVAYHGKHFWYAGHVDDLNADLIVPCLNGGAGANIQIGVPPENLDTTIPASEGPAGYGYMEGMADRKSVV